MKSFLSLTTCKDKYVSECTFLSSKSNKQTTTKKQESKKAKETNEEKIICPENRLKKQICGRPGEDFSRHPHFRKQDCYFLWALCNLVFSCECCEIFKNSFFYRTCPVAASKRFSTRHMEIRLQIKAQFLFLEIIKTTMLHHEGTPKTSSPRICDIIKNKHGTEYELLQKKMIGKYSYQIFLSIQQSILKVSIMFWLPKYVTVTSIIQTWYKHRFLVFMIFCIVIFIIILFIIINIYHWRFSWGQFQLRESVRIRSFCGPYFPAFGREKLLIRTLFTQYSTDFIGHFQPRITINIPCKCMLIYFVFKIERLT